jgi:hypothetical protein
MRSKNKKYDVLGKEIVLSGDRRVFFGRYPTGKDETYCMRFINKSKPTYIRLSKEALETVIKLYYDYKTNEI